MDVDLNKYKNNLPWTEKYRPKNINEILGIYLIIYLFILNKIKD